MDLLAKAPPAAGLRVASLVPSLTELVFDLGLGAHLVARTGFCIHPAAGQAPGGGLGVAGVPKVGGTKDVNLAKLQRLAPTHVLVNVDENEQPIVEAIRSWGAELVVTHPQTPADNVGLIDQMVAAFSPHLPAAEAAQLQARGAALKAGVSAGLAAFEARAWPCRSALYLIWRGPWMTVARNTYISQMLALANWQTLPALEGGDGLATPGALRYPLVSGQEPWLSEVDVVLLSSEPYRFGAAHLADARRLCPQARVALIDGEMMSWYGSRALKGLAYWQQFAVDY